MEEGWDEGRCVCVGGGQKVGLMMLAARCKWLLPNHVGEFVKQEIAI